MKRIRKIFCLYIIIALTGIFFTSATEDAKMKETALFKADTAKREIISLVSLTDRLSIRYISVTTDEPTYWPDEDVFLKVLLPAHPNVEVEMTLTKKDATPQKIGTAKLSGAGMLVSKIASGKVRKLEPGE
jgi:hypothetical protein